MAKPNVGPSTSGNNLFPPVSQVLLSELVAEAVELGRNYPAILRSIEEDQDRLGLARNQLRAECAEWQAPALPVMEGETRSTVSVSPLSGRRPHIEEVLGDEQRIGRIGFRNTPGILRGLPP
jgi:hypothetical protein